jgi:hypothetical protein
MKKNLLTLIILLACTLGLYAQDNRAVKIETIRQELNSFMASKKGQPHTAAIEKQIQQQLNVQEPGHELTPVQKKQRYAELSTFMWENQFWKANPQYEAYLSQRDVGAMTNFCANGGFENGNNAFTHFGSVFSGGGSNNCTFAGSIPFNPTNTTASTANVANRMVVVPQGNDPVVTGLQRVRTGDSALRINSNLNAAGTACSATVGVFGAQVDKAATNFTVSSNATTLSFWFAVVMQDPTHTGSNGQNPFFTARLRDEVTGVVQTICLDPSQNNMLIADSLCQVRVLWQPWRCGTFDLSQSRNHRVTLEFIAADCAATGHFGYAYIDDICIGCDAPGNIGFVTLASNDDCYTNGVSFNGNITLPTRPGSTLQSLTVQLWQNGSFIANVPVTITGNTFTGTVPAVLLTNGANYDLIAVATFNIPGAGTSTVVSEITPGINNDFTATDEGCCDITDTPNFTIQTNCVNGVLVVTATASDLDPQIHQWALFQTTTPGTSGGVQVAGGTGTSVTFNITDYSKFYYIRHRIWDACYGWREVSVAISLPQANNVNYYFVDGQNNPKTKFCYGDTIKMIISGLSNYTNYYLDVWRRPIGSSQNFSFYAGLGWTNGQPTMIDLTAVFAGQNPPVYFDPNFEYEVKLAVADPNRCIAWTEIKRRFTVECCDNFIKADFLLDITPAVNNYQLTAISFNTYPFANALHEWYVLSSPNPTGGPYTPVTSLTSTTQTTVPLFNNAQYGLYYTVIHKIITKCGEVCIKRTQYQTGLGRATDATASTQSQVDCCLAFEFWPNGAGTPPSDFTGKFELGSTPNGNGTYTINTYLGNAYSNNPNVTHEWYVFSSPNPSGGPYTQVGQGTGANFSYSPADYALYYFVIHRVKSPCGTLCYGQSICQNCRETVDAPCELCGPIDCALLDNLLNGCGIPTNLKADCNKLALVWDPVPNAVQYAVEVSFNDPRCCRSAIPPSGFLWNDVRDPYILFASFSTVRWDCLSFRVKAKCENGESAWSDWVCVLPCRGVVDGGGTIGKAGIANIQEKAIIALEPRISPNPNNGNMTLSLQAPSDIVLSIDVVNAQGSRVTTIPRNTYKGGLFTTKLNLGAKVGKGVYTIVFNTNFGTFRKKVIVQ